MPQVSTHPAYWPVNSLSMNLSDPRSWNKSNLNINDTEPGSIYDKKIRQYAY